MKELVILSGKGGTGKTSVAASFALLAQGAVMADCDVDAADLALVLQPIRSERHDFYAGKQAEIHPDICTSCGGCMRLCRFDAISMNRDEKNRASFSVKEMGCEGCGVCARLCPRQAISMNEVKRGRWMASETRAGTLIHAELSPGADASGKLVAEVRGNARRRAELEGGDLVIIDGPPGIGCPVLAAMGHASCALIVTEPTPAGLHDLERIAALTVKFRLPALLCINRWDIDAAYCAVVERKAAEMGLIPAGRIRRDPAVSDAQMKGKAVVETDAPAAADIRALWQAVEQVLYREVVESC